MATPFSKIYDVAIFRFTDFSFANMVQDFREEVLKKYLMSAQSDFRNACPAVREYDLETEEFTNDFDNEVVEILALGVSYHWLSAKVLNSDLLKNVLTNADMKFYSPANLIKEMKGLRTEIKEEYKSKINAYSFRNSDLQNLKV